MEECQNLINKVREFIHFKIRDSQINKFNRLVGKHGKGEGRFANLGRRVGSAHNPQPGRGPSPSNLATTALGVNHSSQLRDVAGNAQDQGLGPRSTTMAPPLQLQQGTPCPQLGSSRDAPCTGAENLDDPSHRWVKNLSSTPKLKPRGPY